MVFRLLRFQVFCRFVNFPSEAGFCCLEARCNCKLVNKGGMLKGDAKEHECYNSQSFIRTYISTVKEEQTITITAFLSVNDVHPSPNLLWKECDSNWPLLNVNCC